MNLRSRAASLYPPLRRAFSEPDVARAVQGTTGTDCFEALQDAKKQVVAWREEIHDRLRGGAPPSPLLAVRVGASEFGGDGAYAASSRSRLYQTRDLWTLLTLANPDQELVIVHETLDPDVLYYYLRLGAAEGRPSLLNRLGRLRTVLLPSHEVRPHPPAPGTSHRARANYNLAVRLLRYPSCQDALTTHLKRHARVSDKPPILSLYQNSPRMEGIAKILQVDAFTTPVPLLWLGSKHGSRQMFEEAGVPHPLGTRVPVHSLQEVAEVLCAMTRQAPTVKKWVIKITDGTASGNGNGILDVSGEARPFADAQQALACLARLRLPVAQARFMHELKERGAIVEAFVTMPEGARTTSPSAQGIIEADGTVHVVSSHEQVLDGATGQSYEGCCYPARSDYRAQISQYTQRIGERLYARGARGHFAVDYIAVENAQAAGGWRIDAIEINLRETGTTPPFMMMQLLCGGQPDDAGLWHDAAGRAKFYVASDGIHRENLRGAHPQTVIEAVGAAGLEFTATPRPRRAAMTGVVLTLLPGVRDEAKVGCICIADSAPAAHAMRAELIRCLETINEAALSPHASTAPTAASAPPARAPRDPRAAPVRQHLPPSPPMADPAARYAPAES